MPICRGARRGVALVAVWCAGLLASCGGSKLCQGDCPSIGDSYSITSSTVSGACDFTPPIVPPSLTLTQSGDGQRVTLGLIDPVNQVPLPLLADVSVSDDNNATGLFIGFARTVRQATLLDPRLLTLQTTVSGSVSVKHPRRQLSGVLNVTVISGSEAGKACNTTTTFLGTGSAAVPSS